MKKDSRTGMLDNRGFTLVEMAVVLVIIGIILGAVIKGQDLINNAQSKQLSSAVSSWRNLAYAYLDRNGRLPGDSVRNGVIGDVAGEQAAAATATAEIVNTMQYAPANPVAIGGLSFWVYFGNATPTIGVRNCMLICKDAACATVLTADELEIIKSLDAAYDGLADAGLGQFRAITAATLPGAPLAVQSNRANAVVTAATAANTTTAGAATAWNTTTHLGAIWLFDRTF